MHSSKYLLQPTLNDIKHKLKLQVIFNGESILKLLIRFTTKQRGYWLDIELQIFNRF